MDKQKIKSCNKAIISFVLVFLSIGSATNLYAQMDFGPKTQITDQSQVMDQIALIVNGEALTRRQLSEQLNQLQSQIPPEIASMPQEAQQKMMLEAIITKLLIKQITKKAKVSLKREDIDKAIDSIAADNHISRQQLLSNVALQSGLNEEQYREVIAEQLLQSSLQESVVKDQIRITQGQIDDQITQIAREQNSYIHLQDLLLPLPKTSAEKRSTEIKQNLQQISYALKKHNNNLEAAAKDVPGARFNDLGKVNVGQIPIRFAREVVKLKSGEMVENPIIDSDGMHFLKVAQKVTSQGQYVVTNAKMAHILIRRNPQNPDAAHTQIQQIYNLLKNGANFSQLASRYSQDAKSAVLGGELGWLSADSVDPRFAARMDSQVVGQIGEPFESSFGWHILLVKEIVQIDLSEEKLQSQIMENLYRVAMQDAWERYLAEMRRNAYIELRN